MATDDAGEGQTSTEFSWLEPHPLFCIILVGEKVEAFGIQKDFLIAKSTYFQKYFAEKKEQKVEDVVRFPDTDPVVFGLAQLFMFTGTINPASQRLPGFDLMIAVWKLGDELGIDGLCEEALRAMSEYRAATNSIPATELLVKAWKETPEGSPIRALLLSWTAEYIRSSETRAEFTKSLPQEVLSELVVTMSHLNSTPVIQVKPPSSPSSAQHKNVHYLEQGGEEREAKTIKHRHSDGLTNRTKKGTPRPSQPQPAVSTKPYKSRKSSINITDGRQFSPDHKLNFCADLLNRMLSGPGFWTRLVGPFREPVRPVEDGVPNYFDKIKKPMDLGTIKKKMDSGEYNTAEEFETDVRQIFENCYTYWGRDHDMSAAAERFQKSFEEKFAEMFKWISKSAGGSDTA
ncbi:Bromodomain-containing protein [Xylaria bambusicola]|uniref:Bromodomain-containing protein n=1 Tax=Xylaria bambusicola TaxID=326684 RepID=UPI002007A06E|nr:Bromodomain-containing protein [Xylaria bambusicola]KAI0523632.1 Bromodomain-containing protein [Xylaria bambusicola]